MGPGTDLAASAWDLPAFRRRNGELLAETATPADEVAGTTSDGEQAADQVALVHRWRRFPLLGPDLPSELFPLGVAEVGRSAEVR